METIGALFLRVLTVSAGCSAVLVPLLLLAPRIRKRIAARSFYVLFLLLALRLAAPVEFTVPKPVVTVPAPEYTVSVPAPARPAPAQVQTPAQTGGTAPAVQAAPVQTPAPAAREVPVTAILGLVWAAGIAGCVLWAVGSYLLARRKLLGGSAPAGEEENALLEKLRGELGVKRPVRLRRSERAGGPLALGLFRPVVVLPQRSCRGEELEFILRHELTHVRRWDVAYKMALSLACAVNWFNPFVWLMSRAAGRNLELCCDDAVVRGLSEGERRRYGRVLLDAAETARPLAFSTSFAGGKRQLRDRLANLFTEKKNSAALVCVVAAAALLAGGLVACEVAGGSVETADPERDARRELFQAYFDENYTADTASVVLADLTGDGLEELLVIALDPNMEDTPSMRGEFRPFYYAQIEYFLLEDGAVVKCPGISDVANAHAGWGYVYLVPQETGCAIVHFNPYLGQGAASYTLGVYTLDRDEGFVTVEQDEVFFQVERDSLMGGDTGSDATVEEVEAFLARWRALRDSGVPLLVYYEDYYTMGYNTEISYLSVPPAEAFNGKVDMDIPALRRCVVTNGGEAGFPLPEAWPDTPEKALDWLESSLDCYPDVVVFRLPNYEGTWDIHLSGRMRMDSHPYGQYIEDPQFMSIHYLEGEEWIPGRRYAVDTEGAWFKELALWVRAVGPDGTAAERTIYLVEEGQVIWERPADIPEEEPERPVDIPEEGPELPEEVAQEYLEAMARQIFLYEDTDTVGYTVLMDDRAPTSYRVNGQSVPAQEIWNRLIYMEYGRDYWKYRYMCHGTVFRDVRMDHTVKSVSIDGASARVEIDEWISFYYDSQDGTSGAGGEGCTYGVDLVLCGDTWLVADANAYINDKYTNWSCFKDEATYCEFTGLPHDMVWFSDYLMNSGIDLDFLVDDGDTQRLPIRCLGGWYMEGDYGGRIQLLYVDALGTYYIGTGVMILEDGSFWLAECGHPAMFDDAAG